MTTNAQRAFWFRKALEEFASHSGEPVENEAQQMQRLLSGMLHYCRIEKGFDAQFCVNIFNGSFLVNLKELAEGVETRHSEKPDFDGLVKNDGVIEAPVVPESLQKFMPQK